MYGLPSDFDASIFEGQELERISFSVNTVDFFFDGEIHVTVESSFDLDLGDTVASVRHTPPVVSSNVMSLLGKRVVRAFASTEGTLTFEFSGGGKLSCFDDSKDYESYHIRWPGREIVV